VHAHNVPLQPFEITFIAMNKSPQPINKREMERLLSAAKYFFTDQRKGMTPMLFETLIFLKQSDLCAKAILMAESDRFEARVSADAVQGEFIARED
jgi:Holliday junction resolvase-like predicted endonuclease